MESVNALALGTALIAIISLSSVLASLKEMQQMKAANTQAVDIRPGAGRQEVVGTLVSIAFLVSAYTYIGQRHFK